MNVNFLEVRRIGLEQLNVNKPYGRILLEGDPQPARALCTLQFLFGSHLVEDVCRGMTCKQRRRRALDMGDQWQVARAGARDPVRSVHGHRAGGLS